MDVQPVFAVCLQAELVPASVQDYREKLLHLRKLRHDLVQRSLPQGPSATFQQVLRTTPTDDFDLCFFFSSLHVVVQLPLFDSNHLHFFITSLHRCFSLFFQVPLRFLIAMLFVNFRPLWDAVIDLIV